MQQHQSKNRMTDKDMFDKYMNAQLKAFHEWVWCFGIDTGMNLRDYFTDDELMHIWITRYAASFHNQYAKEIKNVDK